METKFLSVVNQFSVFQSSKDVKNILYTFMTAGFGAQSFQTVPWLKIFKFNILRRWKHYDCVLLQVIIISSHSFALILTHSAIFFEIRERTKRDAQKRTKEKYFTFPWHKMLEWKTSTGRKWRWNCILHEPIRHCFWKRSTEWMRRSAFLSEDQSEAYEGAEKNITVIKYRWFTAQILYSQFLWNCVFL